MKLKNKDFILKVVVQNDKVKVVLIETNSDNKIINGEYIYRITTKNNDYLKSWNNLKDITCEKENDAIVIQGKLGELQLIHRLKLSSDANYLEEDIKFINTTSNIISVENLEMGFLCPLTKESPQSFILENDDIIESQIIDELKSSKLSAIPFKHKATDPEDMDHSFTMKELITRTGLDLRITGGEANYGTAYLPVSYREEEGWVWEYEEYSFMFFKYNQEVMEFSVIDLETTGNRVYLRFGGSTLTDGKPVNLSQIKPGQSISPGITRFQFVKNYHDAAYAYRDFLDNQGCCFPEDYNPPVHWNELYDNPQWNIHSPGASMTSRNTRKIAYTRELMEEEAAKARDYQTESLYLDPGWDTEFGSFIWGENWLGKKDEFIKDMKEQYGLAVSLHCPVATWMSADGRGVSSWPEEARRMNADGDIIEDSICLGSEQYLETAVERLKEHCQDGVVFLMLDGTWWNGGCWHPDHGHPVPYTKEDHCHANLEIARRIHEEYPDVLIEMHDMLSGGRRERITPVYYKYNLPYSYDENWGLELMWQPMEDILSGRARALYYYNIACNIPLYLHIDLRDDNEHCLTLWWYASTCRHLGIGGTHRNPQIAEAQKKAMKRYQELKSYYTRGTFYGSEECPEEVHFHVLEEKNSVVINLFNLSENPKVIKGSIDVKKLGLDPDQWYITPGPPVTLAHGKLFWNRRLDSNGTDVFEIKPVSTLEND